MIDILRNINEDGQWTIITRRDNRKVCEFRVYNVYLDLNNQEVEREIYSFNYDRFATYKGEAW